MQRVTSVMDTVEKKESERALRSSKRRLSRERVESYYAQIDERTELRLMNEPADQFLTSWNTTIAGPLGTSGAQNVIPPNPKGPMAVRATPLGRNGGVGLGQDLSLIHI